MIARSWGLLAIPVKKDSERETKLLQAAEIAWQKAIADDSNRQPENAGSIHLRKHRCPQRLSDRGLMAYRAALLNFSKGEISPRA
jgi:hypothetical protein